MHRESNTGVFSLQRSLYMGDGAYVKGRLPSPSCSHPEVVYCIGGAASDFRSDRIFNNLYLLEKQLLIYIYIYITTVPKVHSRGLLFIT